MGYFTPEPKRSREDFYNMEDELLTLEKGLKHGKLVVVSGFRRYGKTSLILTYLNEEELNYIYLDCRLLPSGMIAMNSFLNLLEEELSRKRWVRKILSRVEGVSIEGMGIRFKARVNSLLSILHALQGTVLVIDEAQELRRSKHRFDSIIAYIYDHLDIKIILSGSQVGLLYRFLKVEDPEAPLYGRAFTEVRLKKLDEGKSREFLIKGFKQEGVDVPKHTIDEAINRFDGVIGWLTYFGFSLTTSREDINTIHEKASRLALNELEHALNIYGVGRQRYKETLKTIASLGSARWSHIKRGIEARLGRIPNNTLSTILKNLIASSFIEKVDEEYRITDPVLQHGIRRFW